MKNEYLKNNWLGILGLIVGLFGIVLSYFFFIFSQQMREPVVISTKNFAIFSSPEGLSSDKFAVVKKPEYKEINKNIYVNEIAFWNKGRQSIKRENILKSIYISYDKNVEIIDAFITESTRPEIVNAIINQSSNNLNLDFDILEKNDGFKIQVIYVSENKQDFKIQGNIEDTFNFESESDLTLDNIYIGIVKIILSIFVFLVIIFCIGLVIRGFGWVSSKILNDMKGTVIKRFVSQVFTFVMPIIFIGFVVISIGLIAYNIAKNEIKDSVPQMHHFIQNTE